MSTKLTRSQNSRVDDVEPVGGGHDVDALPAFNAVHLGQELVDHSTRAAGVSRTWNMIAKKLHLGDSEIE